MLSVTVVLALGGCRGAADGLYRVVVTSGDELGRAATYGDEVARLGRGADDVGRLADDVASRTRLADDAAALGRSADEVAPEVRAAFCGLAWEMSCDVMAGAVPLDRGQLDV